MILTLILLQRSSGEHASEATRFLLSRRGAVDRLYSYRLQQKQFGVLVNTTFFIYTLEGHAAHAATRVGRSGPDEHLHLEGELTLKLFSLVYKGDVHYSDENKTNIGEQLNKKCSMSNDNQLSWQS